jgi:hypothetical protein
MFLGLFAVSLLTVAAVFAQQRRVALALIGLNLLLVLWVLWQLMTVEVPINW